MTPRLSLLALPLLALLQGPHDDGPGGADCVFCQARRAGPGAAGPARVAVPDVDAQRAGNLRAFEQVYQRQREALFERHAGAWVAIAGGALLPRDEAGRVRPAERLEDAVRAAEAAAPGARQRFVFRIGEEGDVRYRPTINRHPEWIGQGLFPLLAGVLWVTPDGVYVAPRGAPPEGGVRLGDGELGAHGPRATLEVSTGPGTPERELGFVVSTGFEGYAVLGRAAAEALQLARFEIPGALHLDGGAAPLRRARARFRLDGGLLDEWLPVGVRE